MIKSMTAFGRAVGGADGKAFTCEIRSVNNRYLDCSVKLPRAYGFLEEKIIAFVKESGVSRGKIEIGVGVEVTDSVGTEIELDEGYARGYVAALRRLCDEFGLADDIAVSTVAATRDLFLVKKPTEDADRDWEAFLPVLTEAVTAFLEGTDFEDVIRTAVSLGGDCDTLTCIAGSVAEAFYGVPETLKAECRKRLPGDMLEVLDRFARKIGKEEQTDV